MIFLETTPPPNINDPDWPATCLHAPAAYRPLPYLAWHRMAEARDKAGERQAWCTRCERYRWTTTPCPEPALGEEPARAALDDTTGGG